MPALPNPRQERFAQEIAKGTGTAEAYELAGFKPNPGNARRLRGEEAVSKRIEALLERREAIDEAATHKAIEKLAITKERILSELAKIGFSDIRKAVRWQSARITEEDNPEGGDILVIKNIVTNCVEIVGSAEIDDETAAAISEISQSDKGAVKIKLHDKRAALVDIGRHLGMFVTRTEVGSPGDFTDLSADERRALDDALRREIDRRGLSVATGVSSKPH